MRNNRIVKLAALFSGLVFSTLAFSAQQQSTPANAAKPESEQVKPKNNVTPHNHPRDSKGIYIAPKKSPKPEAKPDSKTESKKSKEIKESTENK